jgi:hypothetical protein
LVDLASLEDSPEALELTLRICLGSRWEEEEEGSREEGGPSPLPLEEEGLAKV